MLTQRRLPQRIISIENWVFVVFKIWLFLILSVNVNSLRRSFSFMCLTLAVLQSPIVYHTLCTLISVRSRKNCYLVTILIFPLGYYLLRFHRFFFFFIMEIFKERITDRNQNKGVSVFINTMQFQTLTVLCFYWNFPSVLMVTIML